MRGQVWSFFASKIIGASLIQTSQASLYRIGSMQAMAPSESDLKFFELQCRFESDYAWPKPDWTGMKYPFEPKISIARIRLKFNISYVALPQNFEFVRHKIGLNLAKQTPCRHNHAISISTWNFGGLHLAQFLVMKKGLEFPNRILTQCTHANGWTN